MGDLTRSISYMGARIKVINLAPASIHDAFESKEVNVRRAVKRKEPAVFTDIYDDETNIVIWQRTLSETLKKSVDDFLKVNSSFKAAMVVSPDNVLSDITRSLGDSNLRELSDNIAELVDMYCYLFELKRVGLRLTVLDRAMCPKFHVDRVPCRLVTTYQGVASEWLPHEFVDRTKLGVGSNGKPDHESGIYKSQDHIQRLGCGDVALLKGELWDGNENAGLVHRSPTIIGGERRLLLTLDFSN